MKKKKEVKKEKNRIKEKAVKIVNKVKEKVLPYYNNDFKEGLNVDKKRFVFLNYFLENPIKSEKEISLKEILSTNKKLKETLGDYYVADSLPNKAKKYYLGLPKPLKLRIVAVETKTFINSKGGNTNGVTKVKVTPIG